MIFFCNLINKIEFFKIYIITPLPYSIGDTAQQILFARLTKQKKIFLIPIYFMQKSLRYKLINKSIFNDLIINTYEYSKFEKVFFHTITLLINIEFIIRRIIALKIKDIFDYNLGEKYLFPQVGWVGIHKIPNKIKIYKSNLNQITFKKENQLVCKSLIDRISNGRKIVCIHIRDGKFKKDYYRRPFRNCNINNYVKIIKFLIKKGFYVIRVGSLVEKKARIQSNYFLDYPFSKIKSDLMDLYLIKRSKFLICNVSGLLDVANLFNKICFIADGNRVFETTSINKKSRSILKKIKKNNKYISLNKYINYDLKYHHYLYPSTDCQFQEHNPKELFKYFKSFYYRWERNTLKKNNKIEILFNKVLKKRLKRIIKYETYEGTSDRNFYNNILFMCKLKKFHYLAEYLKKNYI